MKQTIQSLLQTPPKLPFAFVVGKAVDYSLSPLMHITAAKYHHLSFHYFSLSVSEQDFYLLSELVQLPNFVGCNITIPYKSNILSLGFEQDSIVQHLGVANTLVRQKEHFYFTNTDPIGFASPIKRELKEPDRPIIILGSGGASKSVEWTFFTYGFRNGVIVSRKAESMGRNFPCITYQELEKNLDSFKGAIIVNSTPVGQQSLQGQSPISEQSLQQISPTCVYDLIYVPEKTHLLSLAEKVTTARTVNGLEMLIAQGNASFQLWTNHSFPISKIEHVCRNRLAQ